jgi:hypothetical protein
MSLESKMLNLDRVANTTREKYDLYADFKRIIKDFTAQADKLKDDLKKLALKEGTKNTKGCYIVQFEDGSGFERQRRVKSVVEKMEAIRAIAAEKGLPDLIVTKRSINKEYLEEAVTFLFESGENDWLDSQDVLNEEAFEKYVLCGKLTTADVEKMVEEKEEWALVDLNTKKVKE